MASILANAKQRRFPPNRPEFAGLPGGGLMKVNACASGRGPGRQRPRSGRLDRVVRLSSERRERRWPNCRPRDAASLIIIDDEGRTPHILMGRRHERHAFVPGKLVFPGGRVEPCDYRVRATGELHPAIVEKLTVDVPGGRGRSRARALALTAIREAFEEAGVAIGASGARVERHVPGTWKKFMSYNVSPALGELAFIARAITPPKHSRRFDTYFFAVSARDIAVRLEANDGELVSLGWFSLEELWRMDLHVMTRVILEDLAERMARGGLRDHKAAVPYYFMQGACFQRFLI